MPPKQKLAVLNSHPIQYFAPLYRRLAQAPTVDLTVYYCSRQGLDHYRDAGFGTTFQWDIPLTEGYRHKFLPNWRRKDEVTGFFSLVNMSLVAELYRERPHALLVHGHLYFSYLLGILVARLLNIPVLMRCETHLLLRRSTVKQALRRRVMTFFYNHLCAACLAIGTRNREFYRAHQVPEAKLFLVPYTVDNAYFIDKAAAARACRGERRQSLGLPADKPIILFASKLLPRKRPLDLLQAYQGIRVQGVEAALLYVGSGELEPLLRRYVSEQHIPDVFFFGFRNQSELPELYGLVDLFVLPSEDEPWGLILNEVMCAALPVIASEEIGAVPDLVQDGYNGFTFAAGNVAQLQESVLTLLTDAPLRTQMGQNSLNLIRQWGIDQGVQGIVAALAGVGGATAP